MENIRTKVNDAFQQLLACLHPKDRQWLKNKVHEQSLLSEFELLLDQEELEMSKIGHLVTDHHDLQVFFDLLSPGVEISEKLQKTIRQQMLNLATGSTQEEMHAD